jgi:DNA primase
VVGSSGTALTEEQLGLLKRFTSTILFCFDADAAGFKAAQRGIALARLSGFDVRAVVLPAEAGKDPDDAVQKNPETWRVATTQSVPIMQFLIERAVAGRDLANVDDKRAVGALLLPELGHIKDVVEREHWLQTVADLLRMDATALRSALGPTGKSSSHSASPASKKLEIATTSSRNEQAAHQLLAAFIQHPSLRATIIEKLPPSLLPTDPLKSLYNAMVAEYHTTQSTNPAPSQYFGVLRTRLAADPVGQELLELLDRIGITADDFSASNTPDVVVTLVNNVLGVLSQADLDARRRALEADIRRAEAAGDHAEVDRLIRAYHELRS